WRPPGGPRSPQRRGRRDADPSRRPHRRSRLRRPGPARRPGLRTGQDRRPAGRRGARPRDAAVPDPARRKPGIGRWPSGRRAGSQAGSVPTRPPAGRLRARRHHPGGHGRAAGGRISGRPARPAVEGHVGPASRPRRPGGDRVRRDSRTERLGGDRRRLRRPDQPGPHRDGAVSLVVLLSAKGSPGVTTAAVALAAGWPADRSAVVVEADVAGGDLAATCGLAIDPGLGSLASAGRHGFDSDTLLAHSQILPCGIRAVVGPPSDSEAAAALEALRTNLEPALASSPIDVLADCGRFSSDETLETLLAHADLGLIVTRP